MLEQSLRRSLCLHFPMSSLHDSMHTAQWLSADENRFAHPCSERIKPKLKKARSFHPRHSVLSYHDAPLQPFRSLQIRKIHRHLRALLSRRCGGLLCLLASRLGGRGLLVKTLSLLERADTGNGLGAEVRAVSTLRGGAYNRAGDPVTNPVSQIFPVAFSPLCTLRALTSSRCSCLQTWS